jgi:hypothetical protein
MGEERDDAAVGTRRQQAEVALDELVQEPDPREDPGGVRTKNTSTSVRMREVG